MSKFEILKIPPAETFAPSRVWALLAGKISEQKSPADYIQVLTDWCNFLGVVQGTDSAARAIVDANREQATFYREYLQRLPGMTPRGEAPGYYAPAPSTIRKKLFILRAFYKVLTQEDLSQRNPFELIKIPKVSRRKRPTEMLPFGMVKKLVHCPGSSSDRWAASSNRAIRDSAILAVLFGCGMRVGEVENLRISDLKRTEKGTRYFYLRETKSGTDAEQVIPDWVVPYVENWIKHRTEGRISRESFLFVPVSPRGHHPQEKKLSRGSIFKWMKRYLGLIGLDPVLYSPHSARATMVSKAAKDGVPHYEIMKMSRHKSVQMVEYYNKNVIEKDESFGRTLDYPEEPAA